MESMHELSRTERIEQIAHWLQDEPLPRRETVRRIQDEFGVGRTQAYADFAAAKQRVGFAAIGDQLVFGALALMAAHRCAVESEGIAAALADDDKLASRREKAHRSWCRTGHLYIALADKCMRLRPTDLMTNDEGKELLLRALEQGASELDGEDLHRLEALVRGLVRH